MDLLSLPRGEGSACSAKSRFRLNRGTGGGAGLARVVGWRVAPPSWPYSIQTGVGGAAVSPVVLLLPGGVLPMVGHRLKVRLVFDRAELAVVGVG